MNKILMIFIISFSFGQGLDNLDVVMLDLEEVILDASRSSQRVFIDDFTGLQ